MYLQSIIKAVEYIENNLCNDNLQLQNLATEAGYSLYHFHRIFQAAIGDSVKEYIRKRRITEAAKDLVNTKIPIIDIAIKYGFASRESFSRSFAKVYGRNPSTVRKTKQLYNIRVPMTLEYLQFEYNRRLHGLKPEIVHINQKTFIGDSHLVKLNGTNYQEIPLIWSSYNSNSFKNSVHALCIPDGENLVYFIGNENKSSQVTEKSTYTIRNTDYAVFTTIGPLTESVQKNWDYIYYQWLPSSLYQRADGPDIEHYVKDKSKHLVKMFVPIRVK